MHIQSIVTPNDEHFKDYTKAYPNLRECFVPGGVGVRLKSLIHFGTTIWDLKSFAICILDGMYW